MLIDYSLKRKGVVVFGGGAEAELKVTKALDDNARVTVVSKEFTQAIQRLSDEGKIRLIEYDLENGYLPLRNQIGRPAVVFFATDDAELNKKGVEFVKELGAIVCVVDTPRLCDFTMPAIAKVGEIRIGISTGGRSPIVAKLLRQKIEKMLTKEDILQLELQEYARTVIRPKISKFGSRKKFLWKMIDDDKIQNLLREDKLDQAKIIVDRMIEQVV